MATKEEKLLGYLKRVTTDLRQAQRRLKDVESGGHEPIAIVGMACRFPGGVRSPGQLWDLVADGRDAVAGFPADRNWDLENLFDPDPDHPGTSYVREGGFLDDVAGFDAGFFGVGPREALGMAPQQRLALETAWEAIEHAGIGPESLRSSLTSTFIGCDRLDYYTDPAQVPDGSAGYFTIGNTASVVSGRVAYTLGLEGAAVTVDTACSSSLVTMHLAVRALRQRECDLALAGGVFVMSSSAPLIGFSQLRALAPDGRSKSFSAAADGMTMAEGAGMLLVERLSDARRNGHRVLAVIRGSAINQDGASNGLTAPNGPAQERVIGEALADARLTAADVDAVEAHGTGTALGDPIEAQALLATYGRARPADAPLWLGSVKSNIGHTQMAAGVAGVIKMVMAMRHGQLPATLHVDEPTPHVDWESGAVRLLTEPVAWSPDGAPRRAAVSSFGISGTNAHVILEQVPELEPAAPRDEPEPGAERPPAADGAGVLPWTVSARGAVALRGQARALAEHLAERADDPADVGWSLAATRSAFEHRAVVVGESRDELLAGLAALGAGEEHPGVVNPGTPAVASETGPVLVFPGQGSQWAGMGAELLESSPVFAARIAECEQALAPYVDWSLTEVLRGDGSELARVDVVQPVLWAMMVSLAAVWESHGVTPAAVVGHSQGEIAAACVAGALTLDDGAKVVALRSKALRGLAGGGAMASLSVSAQQAETLLSGDVTIAAINGPSSTVVSGTPEHVAAVVARAEAQGLRARTIDVDYASHGPQVDQIRDELTTILTGITPQAGRVPFYSTVTAARIDTTTLGTGYWVTNLREQVRFTDTVQTLLDDGHRVFIEASPHPVLTSGVEETAEAADIAVSAVPTLRRDNGGPVQLAHALALAFATGTPVDWAGYFPSARRVDLPTYAFQRERYWPSPGLRPAGGDAPDAVERQVWQAIEELDVEALTSTMRLDAEDGAAEDLRPALPILSRWRRRHRERSTLDSWRYRIGWKHLPEPAAPALSGTWLVVHAGGQADHPAVRAAVQAVHAHGGTARPWAVDAAAADRAPLAEQLAERLADPALEGSGPAGVLSLLALDQTPRPGHPAVTAGLAATTALVQAADDAGLEAPLWCVTQGAVAVAPTESLPNPHQTQIWGLGRVAALEYPNRWGGLIDLPTTLDRHTPRRLAAVLTPGQPEDQVAIRATAALGRRMHRAPGTGEDARTPWRPDGTTLITGGTGGLGAHVARWLATNGAPHLILTSRRGPDAPGARELADQLTALGTHVTITACDVSDRDALQHLLDDIPQQHPLTAVFHAAGISDLTTIDELDLARVEKVLLPKARAAEHLHDLTRHLNLSAFVLFSSGAASWGSGQQGAYAASNVYLDALAEHRRGLGLAATSIAWGPWGETGMSADAAVIAFFARRGLAPLDTALAIKSVQRALDHGDTALTIADIHWQKFPAAMTTQRPSPFLGDLAQADREDGAGEETGAGADPLRQELAGSTPKQQLDLLVRRVQTHAATILGHTGADAVPANQPLQELGFDSLTAVELSKRLSTATGLRLPRTLVFDHPTATALGKLLRTELTGQAGAEAAAAPAASAAAPDEPIAIVGMACRYPGGIRNPQQLWDLVAAGRDAIGEMPANRDWDLDGLYHPDPEHPGTSYVRQGAFLYDAPAFDPGFFGISPREALAMDPQQRLLLETAWETFENAGIDQDTLHGSDTGVFTGGTFQGYSASTTQSVEMEGYALAGTTSSVISGRVAYTFGLEGPAVTIDTACSSSLVAIHMAAKALARNECGLALAGGVAVMATPATFIGFSRQRGLAPDGRCKPFAAAADGTSWGEGVGLVLLERLSDARRNGHQVLAIVRGSAVNQDGTSNGLTAPNGPSQQRVINQALANARLAPGEVDAVEAHGTGTTLGDPIEAQAILATYGQDRPEDEPLWLGSVKSNIGHTQMAAGVAGVIKMVLALHNDTLPASLYIDEPTPHVDWDAGAVRLLTEPTPWPERERPRRAGVSAFGISGTNAHVILEEAPGSAAETAAPAEPDGRPVPWVVTARGGGALRAQARALADHLAGRADAPLDVGWSLATRRSAFEHRAVVLGESRDELLAGLRALAAGDEHPGVVGIGGPAVATDTGPVLVFPGQGSQWAGMGAELLESSPVFAARIAECEQALAPYVDWSLTGVLRGDGSELARVDVVQPVLWATMVSLAAVWASHGVVPAAVVGHSQGEIAAACVAGALSLADGAKVVALRSRALRGLAGGGAMASLGVGEDEATRLLEDHPGVTVAAVNGPSSTVLSGPPGQVAAIVERAKTDGLRARVIDVDYASHGPQVDEIRDELAEVLSGIRPFEAAVPFYSTVAAARIDTTGLGTDYWVANLRERVRFADTVRVLLEDGHRVFIEASMHPVLTVGMAETFEDADADAAAVATLHRDRGDHAQLLRSVAEAFTTGTPCDWTAVFGTGPRPPVELPTYAFQHQSYWLAPSVRIGGGGDDAVESRIWQAIEDMDVEALTSTLNLDGEDDADGGEEGADGGGAAEDLRPALPILSRWRRRHRERSTLDSWRYQITWKHLPESASPTLGGTWLVLVPAAHAGHPAVHTVVQALRAHGAEARTHAVDPAATGREEFARLLAAPLAPGDGTGTREDANSGTGGVLSLLSLDGSPHPGHPAVTAGLAATTALVQAAGDTDVPGPLWCLTQGAVAVSPTDPLPNPAQAETWGLGRVAALEYPNRWGGLIDLPTTLDHQTPARLAAVLAPGQPEDQVAIRATAALGRRMHRAPITGDDPHAPWRPDGTTLITGGTGGLGAHVARWLATNGAPHLLLTSRRGPNAPGARELADELTALGTRVTITACDVSDRDALQHLLDDIPREHPLTAVFHAAGLPELTAFDDLTVPHVAEVLLPKARAAEHLHDLTRHLNLTAFVLFSSGASAWGSGQQASYAAANAYLDALAEHRRALGLAATSLAWGPWGESGMAADDGVIAFFARRGLATLAPDLAIKSVQRALDHGDTALTIADIDWETFPATFTTQRPSRLIADLARPARESEGRDDPAGDDDPLRRELAGSTPKQQLDLLVRRVQTHVATILGHTGADAVPANQPLQELGFDSLTAVELSKRLSTATGLQLPRTLVFDHPTATALAKHLRAELTGRADALVSRAAAAAPTDEPIAIVSMACRFPGGVRDPRQLWNLVAAGGDAIGGMPSNRDWDLDGLYHPDPEHPGTSYVREGGFLHDAPNFDAGFFGISPREALAMDPQQRILLEAAWETFENAGLSQDDLNGSNTGVFAGGTFQGYSATTTPAKEVEGYLLVGNTASVMSGRVSYAFGLEGPAVTIDTACSSSLVAIHLAGQALNKGECDLALAGGVTVMATPATFIGFSRQRGLAPDGRCKPFAAAADGTSWGEGVGLVLLERLSDARRNGHRVLATIRGSAVNQDGTSNGLTAPNGPSQQRVINQALANARLTAADVDAVEAHGTGTTLGDPIEAQAILATYGQDRPGDRPLWLGSVKSNIGHTQMAAGVAGVIKMVQALHNDTLPASLHIDEPTPHVDWNAGAVRLLTEPTPWPRGDRPRRAGVSSFGISGTNAHLILEEGPEPAPVPAGPVPLTAAGGLVPWVLSARDGAALRDQAAALAARLAGREPAPVEVGWSLATTRSAFEHRAVVVGEDHEHLVAGLQALAAGGEHPGLTTAAPAAPSGGGTVWLFSGQGSQRLGMGAGLYERFPLFAAAFDEVCGLLDPHLEHPLREAVFTGVPGRDGLLDHTTYAQAGLFALQIALARLLGELGVQPDAVAGHSIGEIAAAHVAGVLDLPAACRLVAARATLMGGLPEGGAMASIQATAEELAPDLEAHAGRVAVAALNGPESTVISGAAGPVAEIRERWAERGRKTRTLTVSHAFHSPLMEPVLAGLGESIAGLTYRPPVLPLISNVTGLPAGPEIATPDYWVRHVREPVRFHPAIAHLAVSDAPPHTYLELGPDPVLATAAQHTLHEFAGDGRPRPLVTAVLDRKRPDLLAFTEALARLHTHAGTIGWARYFPAAPVPATVDLPTYRFRHDRAYWLSSAPAPGPGETAARPGTADDGGFWDAVEREDLDSLAHVLGSPADQQPTLGEVLPVLSQWRRRHREQTQVDSWRYQITWKHLPEPGAPVLTGAWPVLIPAGHGEHPAVRAAVEALETHGATVSAHLVEDTGREALTLLLSGRAAASAGVVSLLALDESPCPGHPSVTAGLAATAALVQAADDAGVTGPVWCLTRGAVAVSPGDAPASVPQAEVWGLGRVAALEHPQVWGGLIDLPAALDQGTSAHLAALLAAGTEDQAALRPGAALVRRLRRAPLGAANGHSPWRPDGTTLITGGTGGLGAHVARWLATNGAPHLILTSRRGPDAPGARELADELTALGTRVTITACDVSDRDALQHLLDDIPQEHPLTAVFHIAGVPELARFADLDVPHMEQVLAPKAAAAEHLHDLTRDLDLTAFVLFSSGATSWGSGQQATYAAANAHLDALAEHRRALGLPATSVAWGPWGEAGMAADDDVVAYVGKRGITPLPPAPAITALHDALTHREVTVTVADLDWETFPATFTAQRPSPLIADLVPAVTGPAPGGNGAEPAGGDGGDAPGERLRAQLAASTPAERRHLLLRQVQTRVAAVLGHPDPDTVPPGQPFQELGFDSLSAVELRNRLITATGLDLPPTLIFDHPSCTALAEALRPLLVDEAEDGAADEGRVLSALDTWDSASDPAAVDGPARRRITQRLQALLAKWDGADGTGGGGPAAGPDLETATAEDIFDLIADEFGKS